MSRITSGDFRPAKGRARQAELGAEMQHAVAVNSAAMLEGLGRPYSVSERSSPRRSARSTCGPADYAPLAAMIPPCCAKLRNSSKAAFSRAAIRPRCRRR